MFEQSGEIPVNNSVLWNAMIHPFANLTIRGAIWYQGNTYCGLSGSKTTETCISKRVHLCSMVVTFCRRGKCSETQHKLRLYVSCYDRGLAFNFLCWQQTPNGQELSVRICHGLSPEFFVVLVDGGKKVCLFQKHVSLYLQLGPANGPSPGNITSGFPSIRWQQTARYGKVPNKKMKHTFMAVATDLADFQSPYHGCVFV